MEKTKLEGGSGYLYQRPAEQAVRKAPLFKYFNAESIRSAVRLVEAASPLLKPPVIVENRRSVLQAIANTLEPAGERSRRPSLLRPRETQNFSLAGRHAEEVVHLIWGRR